jgi:hypothetical protein
MPKDNDGISGNQKVKGKFDCHTKSLNEKNWKKCCDTLKIADHMWSSTALKMSSKTPRGRHCSLVTWRMRARCATFAPCLDSTCVGRSPPGCYTQKPPCYTPTHRCAASPCIAAGPSPT